MSNNLPTTSFGDSSLANLDELNKRRELAQSVIQRALKVPEKESFIFENLVRFNATKGHILPSRCRHEETPKCLVCEFEKELKLPSLPEMIFADNSFEIYVPTESKHPFIQFNAYDALSLVNATTLPDIMVEASEAWQKARSNSLPKIPNPFDWTYTSHYTGTLDENVRIEPTTDTIDLEKLMRRDPILFYSIIPLFEDELADNGCSEVNIKIRVMSSNYFVLCRFYLRVDRVVIRVFDCRLYSETGWDYLLRECTKREAFYKDIKKGHHQFITDPAQIWQHLPVVDQKTEKLYYPKSS